jgi:photosystem II stability/assembly factor-like uncharacterized protein
VTIKSEYAKCLRPGVFHRRGFAAVERFCRTVIRVAVFAAAGIVASATLAAAAPDARVKYAPIMPRAKTSTLIDVEQAGSRVVVVGERGHVLYSDDQGKNWQQGKMPFTRMLTGVSFVDDKLGWTVGHQSMIFQTRDGGETWERQLDGFKFQGRANADNLTRTREAYAALSAELDENPDDSRDLELEDALFAFEDAQFYMEEAVVPTNLHDVWFLDSSQGWAVGSFGRLIETRDGGKSWLDISHQVKTPDGFHLNGITGTRDGQIIIAGEGGVIFRSMDTGKTWEQMDSGFYGSFFGVVYDPVNERVTAFGLAGALYQSPDFGLTWSAVMSPVKSSLAGGTVTGDGNTVLVGPGGMVLIIDDADSSLRQQVQADRMNHSSITHLGEDLYILVGAGGVKRAQIK